MASIKCTQLILILISIACVQSANILFALSAASLSHKAFMDPIMTALVKKGHNVTVVSPFPAHFNPPGVTTIHVKSTNIDAISSEDSNFFTMSTQSIHFWELAYTEMVHTIAGATLSDPAFKDLMQSGAKFDLIAFDAIMNDHLYVLPHHFKAPVVIMIPAETQAVTCWNLNIPYPASVHPMLTNPYPTPMNFWHRLLNSLTVAVVILYRQHVYLPLIQETLEKHYPGTPSLLELEKKSSLIFVNTFPSLTDPKPLVPYMVELGGVHCRPAKELNKELETIVESSGDHGFILVSFGSVANGSFIPETFRQKLMTAFSSLNQTIILKFEGDMPDAPKNVNLQKWILQQDLLGHKKCKLFITHGGLFSTLESVYHAVPVVVFPLIYDQPYNALLPTKHGYGIAHDWQKVTAEELSSSIKQLLFDPKFKTNAVKMSVLFKDRPMDPADSSVYWMEYVIRTGGAHHLKTNASHLNFFQYFLLDVILFLAVVLTTVLVIAFLTVRKIINLLRNNLGFPENTLKMQNNFQKKTK